MALLGFLSGTEAPSEDGPEARLLKDFLAEVRGYGWPVPAIETWAAGRAILDQEPAARAAVAAAASRLLAQGSKRFSGVRVNDDRSLALRALLIRLLRAKLPFDEDQIVALLRDLSTREAAYSEMPVKPVVGVLERHVAEHGMSDRLRKAAAKLHKRQGWLDSEIPADARRRLAKLLREDDSEVTLDDDAWGSQVKAYLESLDAGARQAWMELLAHAATISGRPRVSATWLRRAAAPVERVGAEELTGRLRGWLAELMPGPAQPSEANTELLRGLVWAAAPRADTAFAAAVGRFAERCYRKLRGHGPRSPRLGTACIAALGMIPEGGGVAELSRLEGKVRYDAARKAVAGTLERAARAAGLERADLEEMAVPDFGLDAEGRVRRPVADGEAEILIDGNDVTVRWQRAGRTTRGAPKAIREAAPEEVKAVRQLVKEMTAVVAGQASRLERFYLSGRTLPWPRWRQRYLEHPLVGNLARRLAWTIEDAGTRRVGLWADGGLRDLDGARIAGGEGTVVGLWHPVSSTLEEVRAVRAWLAEHGVVQPFKQAHREVYLLTDAERRTATYSNRFAAHLIRQHQFQALCQQRGWKYALQGPWDSFNVPYRRLEPWDLAVEFWVEPALTENDDRYSVFAYLSTDQVRFVRDGEPMALAEVPELAFTEAMRDVDLFTSVASVGNDPDWLDQGERDEWAGYWTSFAFGELNATARTRREVLAGLVPRLKIAGRCRLEDRWLEVRGDLRTYRIHLGSGHVKMEPNNQYLCVVPDRSTRAGGSRIRLPFEGDGVLSVILSKAFLLADDVHIKDRTIRSQIGA